MNTVKISSLLKGIILSNNSDTKTIGRNSGIHWMGASLSVLVGNYISYAMFRNVEDISKETKNMFVGTLFTLSCLGNLTGFCYQPMPWIQQKERVSVVSRFTVAGSMFLLHHECLILFLA